MAQVNVTINGHQYRMACLDGQEDHLLGLARGFSERIEGMRAQFGEVGDMRLTIMAAVTVADELSEAAGQDPSPGTTDHGRRAGARRCRRARAGHAGRGRGRVRVGGRSDRERCPESVGGFHPVLTVASAAPAH